MNIQTLVQGFAKNIRELKAADYKESSLRLQYLDPFWKLLGWDVSNAEQRPPQDVEVLVEPSMDTVEDDGLRCREPDYLFRVSGFPRFIVEAKKPAVHIDTDKKAIFQAKRYAWNATIPFAILTDFEQFRLYDTTLKPVLNEPLRGLVVDFVIDFQDYPAKWGRWSLLSAAMPSPVALWNVCAHASAKFPQNAACELSIACSSSCAARSRSIASFSTIWKSIASTSPAPFTTTIRRTSRTPTRSTVRPGSPRRCNGSSTASFSCASARTAELPNGVRCARRSIESAAKAATSINRSAPISATAITSTTATFSSSTFPKPSPSPATSWPTSSAPFTRRRGRGTSQQSATTSSASSTSAFSDTSSRSKPATPSSRKSPKSATPAASTTRRALWWTPSSAASSDPKSPPKGDVESLERRIDEAVFRLYGVKELPTR